MAQNESKLVILSEVMACLQAKYGVGNVWWGKDGTHTVLCFNRYDHTYKVRVNHQAYTGGDNGFEST